MITTVTLEAQTSLLQRQRSVTLLNGLAGSGQVVEAARLQAIAAAGSAAAALAAASGFLLDWAYSQSFRLVSATRDANGAITTASIVWPDGATGAFTTDTASTLFPGAIDAWHATHVVGAVTKTITQTAVTRDADGAVTAQPAITIV